MLNAVGCKHAVAVVAVMMPSLLLTASLARAQQAPDAGTLLQQQPKPPAVLPGRPAPLKPAGPEAAPADQGPRFQVKGFRIENATLIPPEELAAQLKDGVGREFSLVQLNAFVSRLVRYYASRGYLARPVIPEQDVRDGIVTIRMIESMRGSVNMIRNGNRVDVARVQRMLESRLPAGQPFNFFALEEFLDIMLEQPGVAVEAGLAAGGVEAATNLQVIAADRPLVGGQVTVDDGGSRSTGSMQLGGSLTLSNPTGLFDAASLLLNKADGSDYWRMDYSLLASDGGLRVGANVSRLDYKLTQNTFAALDASGNADTAGLVASYPLVRRADQHLSLSAALDRKELVDRTTAGETGNRRIGSGNVGVNGYRKDMVGSGGATTYSALLGWGNIDQRNAAALATDATSRNTNGSYAKLGWSVGQQLAVANAMQLSVDLRGQFASRNLDSSERFSLGGVSGVRAYPNAEGSGDEGWLLRVELARQLAQSLRGSAFFDSGGVTLNRNTWTGWNTGNPDLPNRYTLAGAGIGLRWSVADTIDLNATAALPIGKNPGRNTAGNNSDGSPNRGHVWLALAARF